MQLDLDGSGTLYEQLARALKRAILQGQLKAGVRLPPRGRSPPISALAQHRPHRLRAAVRRAAGGCRSGSGTYVTDVEIVRVAARRSRRVPPQTRYAARLRACRRARCAASIRLRYDLQYGEPLLDLPLVTAWRRELSRAALRGELRYPQATACASCARRSANTSRGGAAWTAGRPTS